MIKRYFILLVLAFPLYQSILSAYRALRTSAWCRQAAAQGLPKAREYPHISILLPALREQNILYDTLHAFTAIDYPPESIQIIFITTDREMRDLEEIRQALVQHNGRLDFEMLRSTTTGKLNQQGQELLERAWLAGADTSGLLDILATYQTTADVVREAIAASTSSCSTLKHIHYTGSISSKASQLNYAITQLEPPWNTEAAYIGVFDFDSRPHTQSLQFVASAIQVYAPEVLQQPTLPGLITSATSPGGIADSLLHILRTFGIEAYSWRKQRTLANRKILSLLGPDFYFVGSGLYIRLSALRMAGGFPHPVDDIPLGFYAAQHGWSIALIPVSCSVQAYPRVPAAVSSRTLVYHAYAQALKDFIQGPWPPRWRLATIAEGLMWAFGPILWLMALAVAMRRGGIRYVAAALGGYISAIIVKLLVGLNLYKTMMDTFTTRLSFRVIILALFHPCWRALSAWRLFSRLLSQRRSSSSSLTFQKTER
jgi:hypothetical protein